MLFPITEVLTDIFLTTLTAWLRCGPSLDHNYTVLSRSTWRNATCDVCEAFRLQLFGVHFTTPNKKNAILSTCTRNTFITALHCRQHDTVYSMTLCTVLHCVLYYTVYCIILYTVLHCIQQVQPILHCTQQYTVQPILPCVQLCVTGNNWYIKVWCHHRFYVRHAEMMLRVGCPCPLRARFYWGRGRNVHSLAKGRFRLAIHNVMY